MGYLTRLRQSFGVMVGRQQETSLVIETIGSYISSLNFHGAGGISGILCQPPELITGLVPWRLILTGKAVAGDIGPLEV